MSRGLNFKQPLLLWFAKGQNARRSEETVVEAARTEIPELKKLPKDRDQTIIDYHRRYLKGMRAAEPKTESTPKPKKAAEKKSSSKKSSKKS